MPQMAPLSWFFLMTLFSLTFILFLIFNFFQNSNLNIKKINNKKNNKINWKW
uniref:ATP synthase complex subunit 8 n=1 Tax=Agrilinae sp. 5 ACP-2013 TaxID=1434408 RepID=A0A3G3FXA3_9COLE|nr:ATP synthase F0 subunit 8 [Agrilinae sp. 5 ACP-2013]